MFDLLHSTTYFVLRWSVVLIHALLAIWEAPQIDDEDSTISTQALKFIELVRPWSCCVVGRAETGGDGGSRAARVSRAANRWQPTDCSPFPLFLFSRCPFAGDFAVLRPGSGPEDGGGGAAGLPWSCGCFAAAARGRHNKIRRVIHQRDRGSDRNAVPVVAWLVMRVAAVVAAVLWWVLWWVPWLPMVAKGHVDPADETMALVVRFGTRTRASPTPATACGRRNLSGHRASREGGAARGEDPFRAYQPRQLCGRLLDWYTTVLVGGESGAKETGGG